MKQVLLMVTALLFFCHTQAQGRSMQNLVGKWEAVRARNAGGGLEVVDSSTIFIVYGNQKKAIVDYKADFSKTPVWFDFTVKDSSGTLSLKSLIQFINDDLIKWQVFEGEAQHVRFVSDAGDMVYLRRKK
jgi:hypothetical protein